MPSYEISYKLTQEDTQCPSHCPPDIPYFLIKVDLSYSVSITDTMSNGTINAGEIALNTSSEAVYVFRPRILLHLWAYFVSKYFSKFGLADDVANSLIWDLFDFAKTIEADPSNAGKRVLPISVPIDVCSVQMDNESVDNVFERAIKHDIDTRRKCVRISQEKLNFAQEEFERNEINWWIREEEVDVKECSICTLDGDDCLSKGMLLPCSHVFHTNCIFRWILKNQTCPLCRSPVVSPAIRSLCQNQ